MPADFTYCSASNDGRCINRDCRRFVTNSMAAAAARDGDRLSYADLSDGCAQKKEPKQP